MNEPSSLQGKRMIILGCGYVGKELARQAIAQGMIVDALTRNPARIAELRELGVAQAVEASLHETDWHAQTESHYDVVVNCVSSAGNGMEGYEKSYVQGTRSVVQWAREHLEGVGTYIYTSSTGVYPQGDGSLVNEDALLEPASERGKVLQEAERLVREELPCERWFILRLAGIYGPGRHYLLNALQSNTKSLSGSGMHTMNLIHRDDVARALLTCSICDSSIVHRIYNLSDNTHVSKAEMVDWLAQKLGCETPCFDSSSPTQRQVPNRRIDSTRIQEELGWKPFFQSYREGYAGIL